MADLLSIKSSDTFGSSYPIDSNSRTDLCKDAKCLDEGSGSNGVTNLGMIHGPGDSIDVEKSLGYGSIIGNSSTADIITKEKSSESSEDVEKKTCVRQYGGMTLALTASILFSTVLLLVQKLQAYDVNAQSSSFWRYTGIMIPSIPLLMYFECGPGRKSQKHGSVFDTVWPLNRWDKWKTVIGLVCRGILGASSVILRYFALKYMTIGDASVISYSSPILVTILAHFFLGEKTGVIAILTAFLALLGVVIITRPPILTGAEGFDEDTLIGTAFATGSLISSALMTIITRKIRSVQFALMLLVFGAIGIVQSLILTQVLAGGFSLPQEFWPILMLTGVAVLSFMGQMSIILALKMEMAGIVSLIRTCDVVFGFIMQFIFQGIAPDIFSSIGGSIIFLGVLVTAFRKWLTTLPKEHRSRKIFGFLLY